MQLNPDKCKELRTSFNAKPRSFDPIVVNGKELEVSRILNFWVLINARASGAKRRSGRKLGTRVTNSALAKP